MLYMADSYQGTAHVTADQVGDYNSGVTGSDCILSIGEGLRAEVMSANKVRIYDGAFLFGGRRSGITAGSYEDVTIENGSQNTYRYDLICAKYEKDTSTSKENITLTVIKGTPGETVDPDVPEGEIRGGSTTCYMPLYRVIINGITIDSVEQIPPTRKTVEELETGLTAANAAIEKKMDALATFDILGTWCASFMRYNYSGSLTSTPLRSNLKGDLTVAVLNEKFGTNYTTEEAKKHFVAFVTNGDGDSCTCHFTGTTWQGDTLYAVSESTLTGQSFRLNWCVIWF